MWQDRRTTTFRYALFRPEIGDRSESRLVHGPLPGPEAVARCPNDALAHMRSRTPSAPIHCSQAPGLLNCRDDGQLDAAHALRARHDEVESYRPQAQREAAGLHNRGGAKAEVLLALSTARSPPRDH